MSSMVRRIQKGAGGYVGLLTSARAAWGAKLGTTNEKAADRVARERREAKRKERRG